MNRYPDRAIRAAGAFVSIRARGTRPPSPQCEMLEPRTMMTAPVAWNFNFKIARFEKADVTILLLHTVAHGPPRRALLTAS